MIAIMKHKPLEFPILFLVLFLSWAQAVASDDVDTTKHDPAEYLSNTLPVLYINTENEAPIVDKVNYVQGTYYLDANGCGDYESIGSQEEPLALQIKGRGNTSWNRPKKPYRLKLNKKASLLGMPKSKHWVLLAAYGDNFAHGRDYLSFKLSEKMEMSYTTRCIPVEVVLNGDYIGMYFLTEKIRIEDDRVSITEQNNGETDPWAITGGWLLEIDNYTEPNQIRIVDEKKNNTVMKITYHSPDSLSQEQLTYITNLMHTVHNAVNTDDKTSTEWEQYIDIDGIAQFYVVQEAIDNMWAFSGSSWFYKDHGDSAKLSWGPLWDNSSALTGRNEHPERIDFLYNESTPLAQNHWIGEIAKFPRFQMAVRKWWKKYRDEVYGTMQDEVDAYEQLVAAALASDYLRWGDATTTRVHTQLQKFTKCLVNKYNFLASRWNDPEEGITLSELMTNGFVGTEYIINDNLAVVGATENGNRVFVTDGQNHWLQILAGDYYNQLASCRSIGNLRGFFTGKDYIPLFMLTDEPQIGDATLTVTPQSYAINAEFNPAVNEVVSLTGIYNEEACTLQAADDDEDDVEEEDNNIEIALDTSWIKNWSVDNGKLCTIKSVVQIKEPWPAPESDTQLNSFEHPYENYIIFPLAVYGDVNGDGNVTAADVTALYNYILNGDDSNITNGDLNNDGNITSVDVTIVYNILLGE